MNERKKEMKPLGQKSYGHIPHLPGSRIGPGDHKCSDGQKRICCEKPRDKHDRIFVQEKADGSNVGIAKINNTIIPLTRAGYRAETSSFEQHHKFASWVLSPANWKRFNECLLEGERLCGEWMLQAHGTRYILPHEPFICFDIMHGMKRAIQEEINGRLPKFDIIRANTIHCGGSFSIESAVELIKVSAHGAIDQVEGAVWRVERNELIDKKRGGERKWVVDYLAKFVWPHKKDGCFLPEQNNGVIHWNEMNKRRIR